VIGGKVRGSTRRQKAGIWEKEAVFPLTLQVSNYLLLSGIRQYNFCFSSSCFLGGASMSSERILYRFSALALGVLMFTAPLWAQSSNENSQAQSAGQKVQSAGQKQVTGKQDETDPLKRPLSEKQKQKNAKALKEELGKSYKEFLQDVIYIITPEELEAFAKLSNDEERDHFIESIWLARDPTPDTPENEFKEEHYRRVTYANEHFASGVPGWNTYRGINDFKVRPPDEKESHPSGGTYQRPIDEGGGTTSTYPFETWRYRNIDGIGQEVTIEFVDTCQCGDYHIALDRGEKDALAKIPGAGLTFAEETGIVSKNNRFANGGLSTLGLDPAQRAAQSGKEFELLERNAALLRPPKLRPMEREDIHHFIRYSMVPFDVRADFIKTGSDMVLVPVTIQVQNKDITFESKDGVARGVVNIYGHVYTMTDRAAQVFEDTVSLDIPAELIEKTMQNHSVYWKALPLPPGRYHMDIVVKDVKGDRVGALSKPLTVPAFSDDKLASSSLILADLMERVPRNSIGAGNFVIDDTKVRPRVEGADGKPASFRRDQKMNVWMQVYNLGVDGQSNKPSATIEYDVVNSSTNTAVMHLQDSTAAMGSSGGKITLQKSVPLEKMQPGTYRLTIKVNDNVSRQTIAPSVNFAVE